MTAKDRLEQLCEVLTAESNEQLITPRHKYEVMEVSGCVAVMYNGKALYAVTGVADDALYLKLLYIIFCSAVSRHI